MPRKSNNLLLFCIFLLALVLRISGISHGFPYVFHPDEPTTVFSALGLRFNPNPDHFDWPHLYIYINYFLYVCMGYLRHFINFLHATDFVKGILPVLWNDSVIFYLITRCATAFFGALTIVPLYFTGKRLFGKSVGLLAALGYAIFPFQVWRSHYTMPDVAMTFFLACGLYYSAKILVEKEFSNYVLAGFFIGLSASTKYNGGFGIILVPLAHILSYSYTKIVGEEKRSAQKLGNSLALLFSAGFISLLAFIMGTPYAALDYKTFIRTDGPKGAFWQFTNVGSINILDNLPLIFDRVFFKMGEDTGFITIVSVFVCLLLLLYRVIRKQLSRYDVALAMLLVPCLTFLVYVSGYEKARSHYYFIAYPFLALLFGYFAYYIFSLIRRRSVAVAFITLILMLLPNLISSSLIAVKYFNNDTRLVFAKWAKNYLPNKTNIVYDAEALKIIIKDVAKDSIIDSEFKLGVTYDYYISGESKNPGEGYTQILNIDDRYRFGPKITVYKKVI